jgi:hypothetical protein
MFATSILYSESAQNFFFRKFPFYISRFSRKSWRKKWSRIGFIQKKNSITFFLYLIETKKILGCGTLTRTLQKTGTRTHQKKFSGFDHQIF